MDVQRNLEANVEKRTKDTYGPPMGKRLLVFMDDMNMPQVDEYGTQAANSITKTTAGERRHVRQGQGTYLKELQGYRFCGCHGKGTDLFKSSFRAPVLGKRINQHLF